MIISYVNLYFIVVFSVVELFIIASTAGSDGVLVAPYIQNDSLSSGDMIKYPLLLLKLMTRYAEDLIWANKIKSSDAVLNFIIRLTEGRPEAADLRKG